MGEWGGVFPTIPGGLWGLPLRVCNLALDTPRPPKYDPVLYLNEGVEGDPVAPLELGADAQKVRLAAGDHDSDGRPGVASCLLGENDQLGSCKTGWPINVIKIILKAVQSRSRTRFFAPHTDRRGTFNTLLQLFLSRIAKKDYRVHLCPSFSLEKAAYGLSFGEGAWGGLKGDLHRLEQLSRSLVRITTRKQQRRADLGVWGSPNGTKGGGIWEGGHQKQRPSP